MDFQLRRRGNFCGEVGPIRRAEHPRNLFSYTVRAHDTGEVVLDGCAADLQEAVQSLDACLDFLANQAVTA